ncbi:hypothetical protein GXB85_05915 [Cellulomonas sp. APG4]|uniref:hypothetical protein n=1 Tax=Cellulomonas sp. APG4 TaxID=1538656 RepID=UPI001379D5B6|nr:hypothetical protein [Cellulomonas sp. APG4]NCT90484.1 hypothetical protein [Cellulomonas sp. APG4]
MTTITLIPDTLRVTFTTGEKVAGLVRDQAFPRAAVTEADVVPDGLGAVRGPRAPGLGLPRLRKVGTWRSGRGNQLVSVRAGRSALRVRLEGQRWAELLLDVDDPAALASALTPAGA